MATARESYEASYKRNRDFLQRVANEAPEEAYAGGLLTGLGNTALDAWDDALVAFAASDTHLYEALVGRAGRITEWVRRTSVAEDDRGILELELFLAEQIAFILGCTDSKPQSPEYGLVRDEMAAPQTLPEERAAGRFLWATVALLDGSNAEFDDAVRWTAECAELEKEEALLPLLPSLCTNADAENWTRFFKVAKRWLGVGPPTESYLSNYSPAIKFALAGFASVHSRPYAGKDGFIAFCLGDLC